MREKHFTKNISFLFSIKPPAAHTYLIVLPIAMLYGFYAFNPFVKKSIRDIITAIQEIDTQNLLVPMKSKLVCGFISVNIISLLRLLYLYTHPLDPAFIHHKLESPSCCKLSATSSTCGNWRNFDTNVGTHMSSSSMSESSIMN